MNVEKLEILGNLLNEKKFLELKEQLKDLQLVDIADFLNELDEVTTLLVFRLLPKEKAADVFSYLSVDSQAEICDLVEEGELKAILDDLYFDDKVDLLEEMPAYVVKKILKSTTEVERKMINQFLMYPDFSAGSLMTIEFVDLKKEMLVSEALQRIRETAVDKETIYSCYVMDSERHLEGIVTLKQLVLADVNKKIADIMETTPIYVNTHDDQEIVSSKVKRYGLLAVPVVDNENRLVGIITIDDIVDVIEEEATEDFYRIAAIQPTGEMYINSSVFSLAKKRIVWLLFLMLSATLTGSIIRRYESTLESIVLLAVFIPMLMDTAGNAGAQSSTLVIRSLVLGEVKLGDFLKVIWKEARVSVVVGIVLAGINFLRIRYVEGYEFGIAITVASTLVVTVLFSKILGGVLPLLAKKLNADPAVMASPLITTIVDAVALVFYFYFANLFLGISA